MILSFFTTNLCSDIPCQNGNSRFCVAKRVNIYLDEWYWTQFLGGVDLSRWDLTIVVKGDIICSSVRS